MFSVLSSSTEIEIRKIQIRISSKRINKKSQNFWIIQLAFYDERNKNISEYSDDGSYVCVLRNVCRDKYTECFPWCNQKQSDQISSQSHWYFNEERFQFASEDGKTIATPSNQWNLITLKTTMNFH